MNETNIRIVTKVLIAFTLGILLAGCSAFAVSSKNNSAENQPQNEKPSENSQPVVSEKLEQQKEILWDFRKNENTPQNFSKAETKAVLKYLFGNQANAEMEITSRVSGSFTKANVNETLYFITGCKDEESGKFTTDCPHVSWNSDGWIAIYDGTTPIMKINEALGYGVSKVTDVNGDGISELFTTVGYSQSGATESGGSLGHFKNGKYIDIKSFDGYRDNCESGVDKVSTEATVISYIPTTDGKMPTFTTEYFQNQCGDTAWKKITKKQFDGE